MSEHKKIKGKIVLTGQIECLSPLHIGSGQDTHSDMDIMRDKDGKIFIPATSLIGVLRHTILEKCFNGQENQDFKKCWGYTEGEKGQQSSISCDNLAIHGDDAKIVKRDGIRINNKTGLAADKGKFDFELLERGAKFDLRMEFTYSQQNEEYVKRTVRTIHDLLTSGKIHIGGKTNAGLGKVVLKDNTQVYLFDFFHNKKSVRNWLLQKYTSENQMPVTQLGQSFLTNNARFSISAKFKLKSSLIVRSYGDKTGLSDSMQLKSVEDWVIPGTSIKGAIRARAERIVNTLDLKDGQRIIYNLFGFIDEGFNQNENQKDFQIPDEFKNKKGRKGKLLVHEVYLEQNNFPAELQTRIKVDRFTGGVIEGALFDSMPVFAPEQAEYLTLRMEIDDYHDSEAGLLLLVLKDLWSGDLPVGGEKNIGRGVFQGVQAEIKWNKKSIKIEKDIGKLSPEQKADLQNFVDALIQEKSNES